MSDEIRPEDEVEAHGPLVDATVEGPPVEAPTLEATADVEAHGPLVDATVEGPPVEAPTVE